jgi:hypothetical protein
MRRLPSAALLFALPALAGCASATAPDRATRVISTSDLKADRILANAEACGYAGVRKTEENVGSTVTIPMPSRPDPRYQCLVSVMAAKGEDVEPASAAPVQREP